MHLLKIRVKYLIVGRFGGQGMLCGMQSIARCFGLNLTSRMPPHRYVPLY